MSVNKISLTVALFFALTGCAPTSDNDDQSQVKDALSSVSDGLDGPCMALSESNRMLNLFTASLQDRLKLKTLIPVSQEQLPSPTRIDSLITQLDGCTAEEQNAAKQFLTRVRHYITHFKSIKEDNSNPEELVFLKHPLHAREDARRPRVAFIDTGFSAGATKPTQLTPEGEISNYLPLNAALPWDLGDFDSDPTTADQHGTEVINNFTHSEFAPAKVRQSMPVAQVPVILPIKFFSFYDNTLMRNYLEETATVGLVDLLAQAKPSVINMSIGFGDKNFENVRPFRDYLLAHSEIVLVSAFSHGCNFQKGDCPPFPQTFKTNNGQRLDNLINVGSAGRDVEAGTDQHAITSNSSEEFVDVYVITDDNSQTSFLAPRVSRIVIYAMAKYPRCFERQSPREWIRKLAQDKAGTGSGNQSTSGVALHGQPALDIERLTENDVAKACAE